MQFERLGYFCVDPDSTPGKPVWNRTVGLKDSWAKIEAKGGKKPAPATRSQGARRRRPDPRSASAREGREPAAAARRDLASTISARSTCASALVKSAELVEGADKLLR